MVSLVLSGAKEAETATDVTLAVLAGVPDTDAFPGSAVEIGIGVVAAGAVGSFNMVFGVILNVGEGSHFCGMRRLHKGESRGCVV